MQGPPCIKYILKCRERSVKRKSNHKNLFFDQCFLYEGIWLGKTFLKVIGWQFLVPRSKHLVLAIVVQLYCVRHKIF